MPQHIAESPQITKLLTPVKTRLRLRKIVSHQAVGAVIGSASCVLLSVVRLTIGWPEAINEHPTEVFATLFSVAILVGGICGLLTKLTWTTAANVVDDHYQWKDRVTSALQFATQTTSPLFDLQRQDAVEHLRTVNPQAAVPLTVPRRLLWAAACVAVAIGTVFVPTGGHSVNAAVTVRPASVDEAAAEIRDRIEEIEQLADETSIKPLKELVVRLKRDLTKLEEPNSELRETLKTMSEMQQKMQSMMDGMNIEAMDASLADAANALATAGAFKPAANALKQQSLQKAADALENVEAEDIDRTESRPTSEKLAEAAAAAKDKGLEKLSESLDELSESVKAGDAEKTAASSEKLAAQIKKHDLAKSMNQMLSNKNDQLAAAKAKLAANSNSEGSGASADASGQNLAKGKSDSRSEAASRKAGSKSAGNIDGEKTKLDGQRQMAKLTGQLTEFGESDKETVAGEATEQKAQRLAQEAFTKYQKMSEAVVEGESIPLGHRETIRRYFELIRPDGDGP